MTAIYNEIDEYAAQWLRNLIAERLIAYGVVDTRSIVDIPAIDLRGFSQVHLFAGIGGWSLAARLAGWPDNRPFWSASCPCQPYSVAGKQLGQEDARDLWPEVHRLAHWHRPRVIVGEQVAAAVGKDWLDRVHTDLEGLGYTTRAAVVPACAVNAPHRRDRLWFVADRESEFGNGSVADESRGFAGLADGCGTVGDSLGTRLERLGRHGNDGHQSRRLDPAAHGHAAASSGWSGAEWVRGADGKARRVKPGIRLLAHGIPARVGKLRAFGNAIVPQVAAEIIGAYMDCAPEWTPGTVELATSPQ